MSQGDLAAREKQLRAQFKDATTGPHKDLGKAAELKAQLGVVNSEERARKSAARAPNPEFARHTHKLGAAGLQGEKARQQERLQEATSGVDRNPKVAKDARQKLSLIRKEEKTRAAEVRRGNLPVAQPAKPLSPEQKQKYAKDIRGLSDKDLAARKKHNEATLKDATHGAHKDPIVAERAKAKLNVIAKEMKVREALKKGPDASYALQQHRASDAGLQREYARQQERYDEASSGNFRDPKVARDAKAKLAILTEEFDRRGLTPEVEVEPEVDGPDVVDEPEVDGPDVVDEPEDVEDPEAEQELGKMLAGMGLQVDVASAFLHQEFTD
jgi:hypothetical protein